MNLAFKITAAATPLGSTLLTLTKEDLEAGTGFRVELAGIGAGRIVINRNRPECTAANFAQDNYVRVYDLDLSDVIPLGGFFLDDTQIQVLSLDEEGGEIVQFGGPGALSYFGRCALWNINYVSFGDDAHFGPRIDGLWYWYNDQYGDILKRMIDEAQDADRPAEGHGIDDLTYDFTSTTDSAGDTWDSFTGNYTLPTGTNYLDIAQRLRDVGLTIQVSGDLLMQAYQNFYGVDRTTASFAAGKVRFINVDGAAGANIVEELPRKSHPSLQLSRVLVQGDSGEPSTMVTRDAASYNVAREGFAQYPSSHAPTTLQAVGDQALQIRSDSSDVPAFRHIPGLDDLAGLYTPFPPLASDAGTTMETDQTWSTLELSYRASGGGIVTVNSEPSGWKLVGFDDSTWDIPDLDTSNPSALTEIIHPRSPLFLRRHQMIFRKEFTVEAADLIGADVDLDFYADDGGTVWVNGVQVATRGTPFTAGPGLVSVSIPRSSFVEGLNCIAIYVFNQDTGTNGTAPNPGGAIAGLKITMPHTLQIGSYWLGDLVTLHTGTETGDYDEVPLRVYAINWELDDDEWWPRPELGGLLQLAQQTIQTPGVAGVPGSGGGVVTVTAPGAPPMTVERELTNKSGGAVARGDVVVIDPDNDEAFETTTIAAETRQIGVAQEDIASNVKGRVATHGYVELVTPVASVTRGHYGFTSTTVKKASGAAARAAGAFCQFLKGGTEPSAILFGPPDSASGGSGTDLGYFNVEDYGAVHDGVTDDSVAIQDTIDACVAAGGGTIFFPPDADGSRAVYYLGATLQDTSTFNSLLKIPQDAGSITFLGPATLRTDWAGTITGNPAVISAGLHDSLTINQCFVRFERMRIEVKANPKLTAIDMTKAATFRWSSLSIAPYESYTGSVPTNTNAIGLDLPWGLNDQNSGGTEVYIDGFYTGIRPSEQMVAGAIYTSYCARSVEMRGAEGSPEYLQHAAIIQRLNVWFCVRGIVFTGDPRTLNVDLMDVEHNDPAPWATVYDVDDASNLGRGFIRLHVTDYTTGVPIDNALLNGATGLSFHRPYEKRWRLASMVDIPVGTDPSTNPVSGRRIYAASASGNLTVRKPDGTTVDLEASGVAALDDLTDVTITSVATGDMLRYSGAAWVNTPGRWEVIVSGSGPPVAVSNPDDDDWLYAWVAS